MFHLLVIKRIETSFASFPCSIDLLERRKASDLKENSYFLARNPFAFLGSSLTNKEPRAFSSFRQTNEISSFPVHLLFWLCSGLSFQGHTKIVLLTSLTFNNDYFYGTFLESKAISCSACVIPCFVDFNTW